MPTLFDKVWASRVVVERPSGDALLWIDRHFVHEGSHHAFRKLADAQAPVAEPGLTFGVADHYVPTRGRAAPIPDPAVARMVADLSANTARHGVRVFGLDDPRQGIVHVVGPEQGLTLPGTTVVCGDSHTSTHGAFGAIGFGIGASEVSHVLMTQTLWQRKPKRLLARFEGVPMPGVGAKDFILGLIARIGADGARGHAIEYAGAAVRALPMAGRMTMCNMSIEGGARCGMVAPDETTFAWLKGRPFAPEGADFDRAVEAWRRLPSDADAVFDREIVVDVASLAPIVTWGTSPEDALPIDQRVPDPDAIADPTRAEAARASLAYMGLKGGMRLTDITVDRVFIGSCTNARIEDLRAAAGMLRGRTAVVPGLVSPGSSPVKAQAEAEGLDRVFIAAGLDWVDAGCSMCVGMNGDLARPGERVASSTNRNFRGRQGPGVRTHLMSPIMVAAAALTGRLSDVRALA